MRRTANVRRALFFAMKYFYELSRQGKIRRLYQLAWLALEAYGLNVSAVRLLTNDYNTIFRVDARDGQRYALRINKPGTRTALQIQSEMAWLMALRQDTDLLVPAPLMTTAGAWVVTLDPPDMLEARHCAAFAWLEGRIIGNHLSRMTLYKAGMLMAQLHNHADRFSPPPVFCDTRLDQVWPFGKPHGVEEDVDVFPPRLRRLVQQAATRVERLMDELYADPMGLRFLHLDLHTGNIVQHQGRLGVLDFDDSRWAYGVQDIGIALYYLLDDPDYVALRRSFLQGYAQVRPLPEMYPGQLDSAIMARQLDLLSFVLQDEPDIDEDMLVWFEQVEERLELLFAGVARRERGEW
ncbi:MAG: phosphotransferase [Anaerolineales bacterium]|nr:phosphotransferase [Anaerolineales bacterium]